MKKAWDAFLALVMLLGLIIGLVALPILLAIGAIVLIWYCIYACLHYQRSIREDCSDGQ